ncbi:hypothetical protein [Nonomuraea sp. NPDC002799]
MDGSAALGMKEHCGWAVLVALGGVPDAPRVLLRERVTLLDDPALPDQPYHAAVGLGLDEAGGLIARVERSARTAARGAGLAVSRYDFRDLRHTAAEVLGPGAAARVDGLRAQVGAPWTRDHKNAALGALLVLAGG